MSYTVGVSSGAARELRKLPPQVQPGILDAILGLAADPRPPGCRKLTDRPDWRIRVGEYRVIYDIDDTAQTVTVTRGVHRKDAYR